MCVCVYMQVYVHVYVGMHVYVIIYEYVCTCLWVYMCMCIYEYVYDGQITKKKSIPPNRETAQSNICMLIYKHHNNI